jgi:hypothetical protein
LINWVFLVLLSRFRLVKLIECVQRALLARLENGLDAPNPFPAGSFAVQQVLDDIIRAPGTGPFAVGAPSLGHPSQQRSQGRWRPTSISTASSYWKSMHVSFQ